MGLLDRVIRGVNAAAEPVQRATTVTDRSLARADEVAERGAATGGRIVGLRRSVHDESTKVVVAVAVDEGEGQVARYGIEIGHRMQPRLRLGLDVLVRIDGRRAAFDWEAMCDAWGIDAPMPVQRSKRRAPDDGIDEGALGTRIDKRLQKGTRTTGTITALERKHVLGMPSENWTIHLELPDGRTVATGSDEVPRYAAWYAVRGATVPCAYDDQGRFAIDWAQVATDAAPSARFDDAPPPASIAAALEAPAALAAPAMGAGAIPDVTPVPAPASGAGAVPVVLDSTLRGWVDLVLAGHMARRDFDGAVADWQAAGMCSAAQAEAARRAAG